MPERFVPFAEFLRPVACDPQPQAAPADEPAHVQPDDYDATLRAARRFRAALADAVDVALPVLLRAIAQEVLGRELRAAPAELGDFAAAEIARYAGEVLRIRTHPADRLALRDPSVETIADERLQRGELCIELRSGTIDLTFPARLERLLAAWQ